VPAQRVLHRAISLSHLHQRAALDVADGGDVCAGCNEPVDDRGVVGAGRASIRTRAALPLESLAVRH